VKTSEPNLALRTARHAPAGQFVSSILFAAIAVVTAATTVPARAAAIFASSYTSYTPGSVSASYQDPASALGKPNPVLGVLDGSAGGKWLDVTPDQIAQFQYVRFSVGAGQIMFLDAVAAVPEPAGIGVVGVFAAGLLLAGRRRRELPL
jgi:hypothetical protein